MEVELEAFAELARHDTEFTRRLAAFGVPIPRSREEWFALLGAADIRPELLLDGHLRPRDVLAFVANNLSMKRDLASGFNSIPTDKQKDWIYSKWKLERILRPSLTYEEFAKAFPTLNLATLKRAINSAAKREIRHNQRGLDRKSQ